MYTTDFSVLKFFSIGTYQKSMVLDTLISTCTYIVQYFLHIPGFTFIISDKM